MPSLLTLPKPHSYLKTIGRQNRVRKTWNNEEAQKQENLFLLHNKRNQIEHHTREWWTKILDLGVANETRPGELAAGGTNESQRVFSTAHTLRAKENQSHEEANWTCDLTTQIKRMNRTRVAVPHHIRHDTHGNQTRATLVIARIRDPLATPSKM
jgi:hypothetical protein